MPFRSVSVQAAQSSFDVPESVMPSAVLADLRELHPSITPLALKRGKPGKNKDGSERPATEWLLCAYDGLCPAHGYDHVKANPQVRNQISISYDPVSSELVMCCFKDTRRFSRMHWEPATIGNPDNIGLATEAK